MKEAAKLRKEVYNFIFDGLKVEMTELQQRKLSTILKSVYEKRVIDVREGNPTAIKHEILCPKCGDYRLKVGRAFKNYKKKIPKELL